MSLPAAPARPDGPDGDTLLFVSSFSPSRRIIVCEEREGTFAYDASTDAAFAASCRALLSRAVEDGWLRRVISDETLAVAEMADSVVAALPSEYLREEAREQRQFARQAAAAARVMAELRADAQKLLDGTSDPVVTAGRGVHAREVPQAWILLERMEAVRLSVSLSALPVLRLVEIPAAPGRAEL